MGAARCSSYRYMVIGKADIAEETTHSVLDADQANMVGKQRTGLSEDLARHILRSIYLIGKIAVVSISAAFLEPHA